MEHQTLGRWVVLPSDPAYYIEYCQILDLVLKIWWIYLIGMKMVSIFMDVSLTLEMAMYELKSVLWWYLKLYPFFHSLVSRKRNNNIKCWTCFWCNCRMPDWGFCSQKQSCWRLGTYFPVDCPWSFWPFILYFHDLAYCRTNAHMVQRWMLGWWLHRQKMLSTLLI